MPDDALGARPENAPKDYILNLEEERWEYELISEMLHRQSDTIEKVDSKIAVLLAAIGAAMYFFLDKATTIGDMIAAALFSIPLVIGLLTFRTRTWLDSGPKVIVEHFGSAPRETRIVAIADMVTSFQENTTPLERKGKIFNIAIWFAVGISIITVLLRVTEVCSPAIRTLLHPLGNNMGDDKQQTEATSSDTLPTAAPSVSQPGLHQGPQPGATIIEVRKGGPKPTEAPKSPQPEK